MAQNWQYKQYQLLVFNLNFFVRNLKVFHRYNSYKYSLYDITIILHGFVCFCYFCYQSLSLDNIFRRVWRSQFRMTGLFSTVSYSRNMLYGAVLEVYEVVFTKGNYQNTDGQWIFFSWFKKGHRAKKACPLSVGAELASEVLLLQPPPPFFAQPFTF